MPAQRSCLAPALIAAYRAAWYRVDHAAGPEVLRIGRATPPRTRAWLAARGTGGAFVTACNPRGRRLDAAANAAAMARLTARLAAEGRPFLPGAGGDDAGAWPAEPSVLVALETPAQAVALGRELAQNAVVWVPREGPVALLLLV